MRNRIRMIEDAQVCYWLNVSVEGSPPCCEFYAGSVYRVPADISEDDADGMIEYGLAERL